MESVTSRSSTSPSRSRDSPSTRELRPFSPAVITVDADAELISLGPLRSNSPSVTSNSELQPLHPFSATIGTKSPTLDLELSEMDDYNDAISRSVISQITTTKESLPPLRAVTRSLQAASSNNVNPATGLPSTIMIGPTATISYRPIAIKEHVMFKDYLSRSPAIQQSDRQVDPRTTKQQIDRPKQQQQPPPPSVAAASKLKQQLLPSSSAPALQQQPSLTSIQVPAPAPAPAMLHQISLSLDPFTVAPAASSGHVSRPLSASSILSSANLSMSLPPPHHVQQSNPHLSASMTSSTPSLLHGHNHSRLQSQRGQQQQQMKTKQQPQQQSLLTSAATTTTAAVRVTAAVPMTVPMPRPMILKPFPGRSLGQQSSMTMMISPQPSLLQQLSLASSKGTLASTSLTSFPLQSRGGGLSRPAYLQGEDRLSPSNNKPLRRDKVTGHLKIGEGLGGQQEGGFDDDEVEQLSPAVSPLSLRSRHTAGGGGSLVLQETATGDEVLGEGVVGNDRSVFSNNNSSNNHNNNIVDIPSVPSPSSGLPTVASTAFSLLPGGNNSHHPVVSAAVLSPSQPSSPLGGMMGGTGHFSDEDSSLGSYNSREASRGGGTGDRRSRRTAAGGEERARQQKQAEGAGALRTGDAAFEEEEQADRTMIAGEDTTHEQDMVAETAAATGEMTEELSYVMQSSGLPGRNKLSPYNTTHGKQQLKSNNNKKKVAMVLAPASAPPAALSASASSSLLAMSSPTLAPFQSQHHRVLGWKLTSQRRRQELLSALDLLQSADTDRRPAKTGGPVLSASSAASYPHYALLSSPAYQPQPGPLLQLQRQRRARQLGAQLQSIQQQQGRGGGSLQQLPALLSPLSKQRLQSLQTPETGRRKLARGAVVETEVDPLELEVRRQRRAMRSRAATAYENYVSRAVSRHASYNSTSQIDGLMREKRRRLDQRDELLSSSAKVMGEVMDKDRSASPVGGGGGGSFFQGPPLALLDKTLNVSQLQERQEMRMKQEGEVQRREGEEEEERLMDGRYLEEEEAGEGEFNNYSPTASSLLSSQDKRGGMSWQEEEGLLQTLLSSSLFSTAAAGQEIGGGGGGGEPGGLERRSRQEQLILLQAMNDRREDELDKEDEQLLLRSVSDHDPVGRTGRAPFYPPARPLLSSNQNQPVHDLYAFPMHVHRERDRVDIHQTVKLRAQLEPALARETATIQQQQQQGTASDEQLVDAFIRNRTKSRHRLLRGESAEGGGGGPATSSSSGGSRLKQQSKAKSNPSSRRQQRIEKKKEEVLKLVEAMVQRSQTADDGDGGGSRQEEMIGGEEMDDALDSLSHLSLSTSAEENQEALQEALRENFGLLLLGEEGMILGEDENEEGEGGDGDGPRMTRDLLEQLSHSNSILELAAASISPPSITPLIPQAKPHEKQQQQQQ